MTLRWDAVVAGHICLDIIPNFVHHENVPLGELLRPGHLVEVGPVTLSTGGAVSNTGLALQKLGIHTRLMGKIGDDLLGRVVAEIPDTSTSYTIILNPPGIDRTFLHSPAANHAFGASTVDYEAVNDARLFHFGYPPLMRRIPIRPPHLARSIGAVSWLNCCHTSTSSSPALRRFSSCCVLRRIRT